MPCTATSSSFQSVRVRSLALYGLLLAALTLPVAQAHGQLPDVLRLPFGHWGLHAGNDPECAQPVAPSCTTEVMKFEDWSGAAGQWQRIDVALPADLQATPQLGLLVQGEYPVYEVYVNGQMLGSSGNFARHRGPQYATQIFSFPSSLARNGHVLIAIHALGVHTSNHLEGFVPTLAPLSWIQAVGDQDKLRYLSSSWLHYLCFLAMFGSGIVFFLLLAVNPQAHEYFWLGVRLCSLLMFRLSELSSVIDLSVSSNVAQFVNGFFNATGALVSIEFVFSFLGRPVPKAFRAVQILGLTNGLVLLLVLPLPHSLFTAVARFSDGIYVHHPAIAGTLLSAMSFFLLVPVCFKSKLPEMRWIGAATLFFAVVESNRMLGFLHLPNIPQDFFWRGLDVDMRAIANLLFAMVMLVAMTFRLRRIQDRNRNIEQEMAAARSVQQVLIPDQLPSIPGLTIESAYLPAQEVGGDFFQILPIANLENNPEKPIAFIVLGDVSGKGLKAAMTVSLIVGTLRTSARQCNSPAELLGEVNRSLVGRSDGFATCLALMVEPSGNLTLANAGHPNPYLNGTEIHTEANLPLGLAENIHYSEITLQLPTNQTCTLVTDGVVEATSATTRELFGFDRTQAVSRQPASSIAEAARVFGLGAPQADDITVLTIARVPAASPVMA